MGRMEWDIHFVGTVEFNGGRGETGGLEAAVEVIEGVRGVDDEGVAPGPATRHRR